MRQIVLDTETTGLEPTQGHRIVEIGCVEIVNRRVTERRYHQYLNPGRAIDNAAIAVHGITNEFLADKPCFADIAPGFLSFIAGAELIIHNAPFDVGFINHELRAVCRDGVPPGVVICLDGHCTVLDTLALARSLHPGQKNGLDALCKRYSIDNSHRALHGALLDAEILADVYLAMTGGQVKLFAEGPQDAATDAATAWQVRERPARRHGALPIVRATPEELLAHEAWLDEMQKKGGCLWRTLEAKAEAEGANLARQDAQP